MEPYVVTPEDAGQRLDHVLARLVPDMGLRGRRRLCGQGGALVNGRPAREAYKVRPGDVLELVIRRAAEYIRPDCGETGGEQGGGGPLSDKARLVMRGPHLAAVYKPAGMHSAALAGKRGPSLQAMLPGLLGAESGDEPEAHDFPCLLNRLDQPTSGLVMVGLDRQGRDEWRLAQEGGRTEKRYLALLEGELPGELVLRQRLEPGSPQRVKAVPEKWADSRRFTTLIPLAVLPGREVAIWLQAMPNWMGGDFPRQVTLAGCIIRKGARHQIRAHAAFAGLPLLGDARYGAGPVPAGTAGLLAEQDMRVNAAPQAGERFFLHHGLVRLPDFWASCPPVWLEVFPEPLRCVALNWLDEPARL